tara:strand:+ start:303 stop:539 length:237 start_codon:yes stop_codon:yes gene_type:complete
MDVTSEIPATPRGLATSTYLQFGMAFLESLSWSKSMSSFLSERLRRSWRSLIWGSPPLIIGGLKALAVMLKSLVWVAF